MIEFTAEVLYVNLSIYIYIYIYVYISPLRQLASDRNEFVIDFYFVNLLSCIETFNVNMVLCLQNTLIVPNMVGWWMHPSIMCSAMCFLWTLIVFTPEAAGLRQK